MLRLQFWGMRGFVLWWILRRVNSCLPSFRGCSLKVLIQEIDTLRIIEFDGPIPPEDEEDPHARYDFHPSSPLDHYTRFPIHCPVEVLQSCIDKVRSLKWLPRKEFGRGVLSTGGEEYERVKGMLIGEYGWGGDGFREEEWRRDCERIWEEGLECGNDGDPVMSKTVEEGIPNTGHWSRYVCWQQ
jgi:hypothetical protein